jgi:Rrf2 family protein
MKLGDGVEAAIHCAALLAGLEDDATIPGFALAGEFGLSPSYLLKHLKALTASGILESVPGPSGGYRLARAAETISLLDIVLAVEGTQPAFRCCEIRRRGPARLPASAYVRPCGINVAMLRAEKAWRNALAAERLSDLVAAYEADADPRSVAARRAFLELNRRPRKSAPARQA